MATHLEAQVRESIERLRPAMNADGGDIEVVSVVDGAVSVRLKGTCLVCPSSSLTIKQGVERALKEQLPWVTEVIKVP